MATLTEKTSRCSLFHWRAVRHAKGPPKIMKALCTSGNPSSLSSAPTAGVPLFGIVVGESDLGVVTSEHGALFEGVLYWALVVRAGLPKHVIEEPGASGASRILVFYGRD